MSEQTLAERIATTLDDHTLVAIGLAGGFACACTYSSAGAKRVPLPGDELQSVRRHHTHLAEALAELTEAA